MESLPRSILARRLIYIAPLDKRQPGSHRDHQGDAGAVTGIRHRALNVQLATEHPGAALDGRWSRIIAKTLAIVCDGHGKCSLVGLQTSLKGCRIGMAADVHQALLIE